MKKVSTSIMIWKILCLFYSQIYINFLRFWNIILFLWLKKSPKSFLEPDFSLCTYIKPSKYMKLTNNIEQIQNSFKIGLACFHTSYIELKYTVLYHLHINNTWAKFSNLKKTQILKVLTRRCSKRSVST